MTTHAIKRVFAWQIEQAMKAQGISKAEMARRMHTSRTQLNRLLDPDNDRVQLDTVQRAAAAIGLVVTAMPKVTLRKIRNFRALPFILCCN